MKYCICLAILGLLVLAAPALAEQATTATIQVQAPSSFILSPSAKAIDTVSNEYSMGGGEVSIVHTDHALFMKIPIRGRNGTRLISLDDPESGIVFRNNTMILPIYDGSLKTANLVIATGNISADSSGFFGVITGLELDTSDISVSRNGISLYASASIFLRDLSPGESYRLAFVTYEPVEAAVSRDLSSSNLTIADMPAVFEIAGKSQVDEDAMSFAIITLRTDTNWSRLYGGNNTRLYQYKNSTLSRPQSRILEAENGSYVYQVIVPDSCMLALVAAAVPPTPGVKYPGMTDLIVLGSVLIILIIALIVMVQRAGRR